MSSVSVPNFEFCLALCALILVGVGGGGGGGDISCVFSLISSQLDIPQIRGGIHSFLISP